MTNRRILIKGNPKYWINGISEKFYSQLNSIFDFNEEYESNILPSEIPFTFSNDIIVVFSRGCRYLSYFRKHGYKGKIIAIGCGKSKLYNGVTLSVNNPDDYTFKGDTRMPSLKAHWTLTPEMKKKLRMEL